MRSGSKRLRNVAEGKGLTSKKNPPQPSSIAAPEAVGSLRHEQSNSKASKSGSPESARPVALHRTHRKVRTTQLDSITSGEEFNLQDIEEDDDVTNAPGPGPSSSNGPPELVPQSTGSQQVGAKIAHNLLHFFTKIETPTATKNDEKVQKACVLCIKAHGTDKDKVPKKVPNYFYKMTTGNTNL
ncbi:hypothetical protein BJV78DRAFT_1158180 [Lactifluus subvellereus]|nr:hypothetical protein BJV78DRAFT_1158180 [Lactifluus subvellereus]